jgi:hypothetical protein
VTLTTVISLNSGAMTVFDDGGRLRIRRHRLV